jgi:hypothetical protein
VYLRLLPCPALLSPSFVAWQTSVESTGFPASCQGGMLDESYWNGFRRWNSHRLRQPGILSYWDENRRAFREEFITHVDSLLETNREQTSG